MSSRLPHLTAFVPNGEDRQEIAVLLVGTADEFGIDQTDIFMVQDGFYISEALADRLYEDSDTETPDEAPATTDSKTNTNSGKE